MSARSIVRRSFRAVCLVILMPSTALSASFAHDGWAQGTLDDVTVAGRAVFASEVSEYPGGVLIRARASLADGGEGTLVLDLPTATAGTPPWMTVRWYEMGPSPGTQPTLRFDGAPTHAAVEVVDYAHIGGEVAARVRVEAHFEDGPASRELMLTIVTTPSPESLRREAAAPLAPLAGPVVYPSGPDAAVDAGCGALWESDSWDSDDGYYDDGYYEEDYEEIEYEEIEYEEIEYEEIDYDTDDSDSGSSDSWIGDEVDDGWGDCVGDAYAASKSGGRVRAAGPLNRAADRVLAFSPWLLLLLVLLGAPRGAHGRGRRVRPRSRR